jgi:roadblock/LC7 domain-containing protein
MATSRRNRYSKSLEGLNAIGFVSPASAYTAATTFGAFVASAADSANQGKLGIFLENGDVKTTALAAGDKFQIAQIVDGNIKKTPFMVFGTANGTKVRKTAAVTPVKQVVTVGYNGTAGTTGIAAPSAGSKNTYVLSVRDTSPANQPFPVQEGRVEVTNSSASIYDIAASLVTDLQNLKDYYDSADINFVEAKILLVGTDTQIATVTGTFSSGSDIVTYSGSHTLAVGEIVSIGNAATSQVYKVAEVLSATQVRLDRPFVGATVTTGAGGTYKVTVPTNVGIVMDSLVDLWLILKQAHWNLRSILSVHTIKLHQWLILMRLPALQVM